MSRIGLYGSAPPRVQRNQLANMDLASQNVKNVVELLHELNNLWAASRRI